MNTLLDQERYQKISNTRSSTVEAVIGAMKGENIDNLQINSKKRLQETFNILMLGYKPKKKIQHPPKTKKRRHKNQTNQTSPIKQNIKKSITPFNKNKPMKTPSKFIYAWTI